MIVDKLNEVILKINSSVFLVRNKITNESSLCFNAIWKNPVCLSKKILIPKKDDVTIINITNSKKISIGYASKEYSKIHYEYKNNGKPIYRKSNKLLKKDIEFIEKLFEKKNEK